MLRAATTSDLTRLLQLVREMHSRTEFAERGIALSDDLVRKFLFDGVRKHGGQHSGSTLLNVIDKDGEVQAFMLGFLQPVYAVCAQLEAQDFWLYSTKKAPKIAPTLLIAAYVEWAANNPKVADVMLSWTDVVGVDGERLGKLYQRKGFRRCGEIWKRGFIR